MWKSFKCFNLRLGLFSCTVLNVDNDPPIAADTVCHWSPPNDMTIASHVPFAHIASVAKRAHERDDHCPIAHNLYKSASACV